MLQSISQQIHVPLKSSEKSEDKETTGILNPKMFDKKGEIQTRYV